MTGKKPVRIDCVVGTRPNFVKIAPIMRALQRRQNVVVRLIHTGQHYDTLMDAVFFRELDIPEPDVNLKVGSGHPADQLAKIITLLKPLWQDDRPDLLIVVGDVTSTLAATLTASTLAIPVAHVEAGLRSFDRTMPEELNRLVVDQLSELHFATEQAGIDNLVAERIGSGGAILAGNVMIDTLFHCLPRAVAPEVTLAEAGVDTAVMQAIALEGFGLVTLHRPSNVDDPARLEALLKALARVSHSLPLVFALHPRTQANVMRFGLASLLDGARIAATPPLSYLRALGAMRAARVVMTDSGGIQEETTALGVPCLTVRDNTERPVTIDEGTNTLVGSDPAALEAAVADILAGRSKAGRRPALWDGKAADRIADAVIANLGR